MSNVCVLRVTVRSLRQGGDRSVLSVRVSVCLPGSPVRHGGEQRGGVLHRLRQHRHTPGRLQQQRADDQTGEGAVPAGTPDVVVDIIKGS